LGGFYRNPPKNCNSHSKITIKWLLRGATQVPPAPTGIHCRMGGHTRFDLSSAHLNLEAVFSPSTTSAPWNTLPSSFPHRLLDAMLDKHRYTVRVVLRENMVVIKIQKQSLWSLLGGEDNKEHVGRLPQPSVVQHG
jgi:hypothetical protein